MDIHQKRLYKSIQWALKVADPEVRERLACVVVSLVDWLDFTDMDGLTKAESEVETLLQYLEEQYSEAIEIVTPMEQGEEEQNVK